MTGEVDVAWFSESMGYTWQSVHSSIYGHTSRGILHADDIRHQASYSWMVYAGLLPARFEAITYNISDLSIEPSEQTNINEIWNKMLIFYLKKMNKNVICLGHA